MRIGWQDIDEKLRRLAVDQAARDYEIGIVMLEADRARAHEKWGFRSVGQYLEHRLGMKPGTSMERLRFAKRLESMPLLADGLREGRIHFSIVREITRVALPENEAQWLV